MSQPIETVIIRAQQNFDVVGGLNPKQIEIEENKIINVFKKYRSVLYNSPWLIISGIAKKRHKADIYHWKRTEWDEKAILNGKIYDLIAIIDLNKISIWTEIKGQSIWVSVFFKDQKERNNNSHLCFPFVTRSFNNLTSFSTYL